MTADYLELARRRLSGLRRSGSITSIVRASECEKSEMSEESPPSEDSETRDRGLSSLISLLSQSAPVRAEPEGPLLRARRVRVQQGGKYGDTRREISEISELRPVPTPARGASAHVADADGEKSEERSAGVTPPTPLLL